MTSSPTPSAGEKFQTLVDLMARLRAPGGCPWDREQTFDTIKPYLLEETYEVMDAIDARDWRELAGELGDLMLQAVFFSQMAAEEKFFNIEDALDRINEKLVRRHPHVFGSETARTGDDVRKIWSEVKEQESRQKDGAATKPGLLGGVPRALPALVEAQQITSRAAGVGYDWSNADQVLDKLVKVDPEQALRGTNAKFRRRFGYVEEKLSERGASPADSNIEEMESLWQQAKARETSR